MSTTHLFWHGTKYGLEISSSGEVAVTLIDGENTLQRTSVEQVADEIWVSVCATYFGGSVVENLKIYLGGVVCTYTGTSTGLYSQCFSTES